MDVINQPWDGLGMRMGDYIIRLLSQEKPRFDNFRACVAFAKASGLLRLAPALQSFIARGGRVEIVIGVDEGITTKQALEMVLKYSTVAFVFNNPLTTFHPKVYLFDMERKAIAFIGSSNLTTGGLFTNYEANIGIELNLNVSKDQEVYERILRIFSNVSDLTTGNAKRLDKSLVDELLRIRKIADETKRTIKRSSTKQKRIGELQLFPRSPVPPAPPIASYLVGFIPKIELVGDYESNQEAVKAIQSWKTYIMILGIRDTRQQKGYSRDVYIPIAARDFNQDFWGWPEKFSPGITPTVGNYQERRISMLVRPVTGLTQVIEDVRLYYYNIKHEFRLNCGHLVEGAKPGDLLVIQKSPIETLFRGLAYEFEATVIPPTYPSYHTFEKECAHQINRSIKRWGYL